MRLVAGDETTKRRHRPKCRLILDDGEEVEVDASSAELRGWKPEIERARWAELEARPWSPLFADVAPGPHLGVRIEIEGPRAGARVRVLGEAVLADAEGEWRGYRGAPARRLARIVAARIDAPAVRPDRKRERAEPPRRKLVGWRVWTVLGALLSLGGAAYMLSLDARLPPGLGASTGLRGATLALACIALLALLELARIRSDRDPAVFDDVVPTFPRAGDLKRAGTACLVIWTLIGILVLTVLTMIPIAGERLVASPPAKRVVASEDEADPVAILRSSGPLVLLPTALGAIGLALARRRSARLARLLLAPVHDPAALRPGAWVTLTGVARAAHGGGTSAAEHRTQHVYRGEDDDANKTVGSFTYHPWKLEHAHGEIDVEPGGTIGSRILLRTGKVASFPDNTADWVLSRRVSGGARVVVAGRLAAREDGALVLAARGEESLVIYASDGDPRAVLKRGLVVLSAYWAVAALALGAFVWGLVAG